MGKPTKDKLNSCKGELYHSSLKAILPEWIIVLKNKLGKKKQAKELDQPIKNENKPNI